MNNLESHDHKKIDGIQLDLPLGEEIFELENNRNNNFDIDKFDFNDLQKIQVEEPENYEAIMAEIERQIELDEIEKAAASAEAEENFIKEQERIKNLRASIDKALEDNNEIGNMRKTSDASEEYARYTRIKLQGGGIKNSKGKNDGKNYRSSNNPNDLMSPFH